MSPLRNWVLIGLFFVFAAWALIWFSAFIPGPEVIDEEEFLIQFMIAFLGAAAFALGAVVAFVLWFALSNRDMNRVTGGWFLTPVWTILLIVPIVQFVAFYMMARHIHRAQVATGVTGWNPIVVFLLMWLVLPVGVVLAQLQMQKIDASDQELPWWAKPPYTMQPAQGHWQPVGQEEATAEQELEWEGAVFEGTPGRVEQKRGWQEAVFEGTPEPASAPLRVRVRPEVVAMPASGVAALFFAFASIPLSLFGPAGIAAGLAALYSRERFLDVESREPGHRGARVVSRLHWLSLVGIVVGCGVSLWMFVVLVVQM